MRWRRRSKDERESRWSWLGGKMDARRGGGKWNVRRRNARSAKRAKVCVRRAEPEGEGD